MSSQPVQTYWKLPPTDETNVPLSAEFAALKKEIIAHYGKENIRKSWLQVTKLLAEENIKIAAAGSSVWPEVNFKDLDNIPKAKVEEIKSRGALVIRGIFPEEQARGWLLSLDNYLKENSETIQGFPKENPWAYRSFFSPVQNAVRSHSNSLKTQEFLNRLWEGYSSETASPFPLTYADGLRFRRPGGFSETVRPHIDAGSLDRWGDETYRQYYDRIFSGDVLSHDPYDLTWRSTAESAKYEGWQQSTVFRAFQGWTSLSHSGGGFGKAALAVYPAVGLGIAYVLLRPFFRPPPHGSLDPAEWEWDDTPGFPGAYLGQSQQVAPSTHPHLELEKTLALLPRINPGDAVFWHSDVIHAVDPTLEGAEPATVLYIPAVPLTKRNLLYVVEQREKLLNRGETPPDFSRRGVEFEDKQKGWVGAAGITNLQGRQALGLESLPGEGPLAQWSRDVLGYA